MFNFVDSFVDGLDYAARSISDLCFGEEPSNMLDIETVDSENVLVCKGGVLLTVFEVQGCGSVVGSEEFMTRVSELTQVFRARLSPGSGHTIKIIFESDPDNISDDLERRIAGSRSQVKRMGLDIEDILDEKVKENSKFCQRERLWLCFYTAKAVLNKADQSVAEKRRSDVVRTFPASGEAQSLLNYYDGIRKTHSATMKAVLDGVEATGLACKVLDADAVLRNSVYSLQGPDVARHWTPDTLAWGINEDQRKLRNDAIGSDKLSAGELKDLRRYIKQATAENDESLEPFFPRSLRSQIVSEGVFATGNFVVTRNRIYAPVHVVRHAYSPTDFEQLLKTMSGTPFRISFTLTPDGLSENYINSMITDAFSWVSSNNRQIHKAREQLEQYIENSGGTAVGLSLVATTWAPLEQSIDAESNRISYNTANIESRVNKLIASCTDWGSTHAAGTTPDPTEAVFSTIPGLIRSHVTSVTPAPLEDVMKMIPISRVRTPWDKGAVLYRTSDGIPISYEQFSSEQKAWITLVMGPMGSAKSSQMNALNLGFITQSSDSGDIPYLRGIDFGYSGKGIVDIVRSGLPQNQQYRAKYIRMKNDENFSTNVFDTPRGSRKPLPNQELFLGNFLQSIANSMKDYPSLEGLCNLCIAEAYKRYTDENFNSGAKLYSRGTSVEVDLVLEKLSIAADNGKTTWWSIVDSLFDAGDIHTSGIAQRYAVPTLEDIVGIATSPDVVAEYGENVSGHPVTELFSRSIREAIDSLPFLRSVTKFDISDSEILMLDLAEMIPSGAALSERQKVRAAIIFLVAMRILSADFFMDDDYLPFFHPKYREYHYKRLKRLSTLKKRFFVDERHRIKGVAAAEAQTDQMIVEGRKFFVDVMQGSQKFDDFSKTVQDQSTTIVFCGSGSMEATEGLAKHYGLNATQKKIIQELRGPIPNVGAPALFKFNTKASGDQYLHLFNTEGPLMLCAIATEAADRFVRGELYRRCSSTQKARQIFAQNFPSGSVKGEVKRREELVEEGLYKSVTGHILEDLVEELANTAS